MFGGVVVAVRTQDEADGHHSTGGDGLQEPQHQEGAEPGREAGGDPRQHLQSAGQHQRRLAAPPAHDKEVRRGDEVDVREYLTG